MTSHYNRRWLISIIGSSPNLDLILVNRLTMLSSFAQFSLRRGRVPPSPCCKFFIWLAIKIHCWTADRLAKRVLPHPPACPLLWPREWNSTALVSHLRLYPSGLVRYIILQKINLASVTPASSQWMIHNYPRCSNFLRKFTENSLKLNKNIIDNYIC